MSAVVTGSREVASAPEISANAGAAPERSEQGNRARHRAKQPAPPHRYASDDEILGIHTGAARARPDDSRIEAESQSPDGGAQAEVANDGAGEAAPASADRAAALEAHPELRQAWDDAQAYRQAFATPEEARAATVYWAI